MKKQSSKKLTCENCKKTHYRWGALCGTCYNQSLKKRSASYRKCLDVYESNRRDRKHHEQDLTKINKICTTCSIEFKTNYLNQKRCRACYRGVFLNDSERAEIACKICSNKFTPKRKKQYHCSRKCFGKYYYGVRDIEKRRIYNRVREAQDRGATGSYKPQEWTSLKVKSNYACLMCKQKEPIIKLTIDHIIPISKGGSNNIENLQPLCRSCNSKKGNKIYAI